jgi:hypothetical protein
MLQHGRRANILTRRRFCFDSIAWRAVAVVAVLLAQGTATGSAAKQQGIPLELRAEARRYQDEEARLERTRSTLEEWLADKTHVLSETVVTDGKGIVHRVPLRVTRSELQLVLAVSEAADAAPAVEMLAYMLAQDARIREAIRTQMLPSVNRRLDLARQNFQRLLAVPNKPELMLTPGEYSYLSGRGSADVDISSDGGCVIKMTYHSQPEDTYTLTVKWDATSSKYTGSGVAKRNREFPGEDVPASISQFDVAVEYRQDKKGFQIFGGERWGMNGLVLIPKQ